MPKKSDEDLFRRLTGQGVLEPGKRIPTDVVYNSPQGKIRYDRILNKELEEYIVRRATPQTDLLVDPERKYVLPHVMACSPIFKIPPITDDIYRYTTDEIKEAGLFLVLSRSYVKRLPNGLILWDPFFVVIKKKIVVRTRCTYHPTDKVFTLKEIHLWQNNNNAYYRIADPRLQWETVPGVLERYVEYEEIFKPAPDNEEDD